MNTSTITSAVGWYFAGKKRPIYGAHCQLKPVDFERATDIIDVEFVETVPDDTVLCIDGHSVTLGDLRSVLPDLHHLRRR